MDGCLLAESDGGMDRQIEGWIVWDGMGWDGMVPLDECDPNTQETRTLSVGFNIIFVDLFCFWSAMSISGDIVAEGLCMNGLFDDDYSSVLLSFFFLSFLEFNWDFGLY